jgi:Zn-dependent peptidase ImmA (M78 family)
MTVNQIIKKAEEMKKEYETENPFELGKELGINIEFYSMGNRKTSIKGFYVKDLNVIVINSDLSEREQQIICYHEIGHYICNCEEAISFFPRAENIECRICENEANFFATEFMLPDEDVLSRLKEVHTIYTIASELCVPVEFLLLKLHLLKNKGYKIEIPIDIPNAKFLGA